MTPDQIPTSDRERTIIYLGDGEFGIEPFVQTMRKRNDFILMSTGAVACYARTTAWADVSMWLESMRLYEALDKAQLPEGSGSP